LRRPSIAQDTSIEELKEIIELNKTQIIEGLTEYATSLIDKKEGRTNQGISRINILWHLVTNILDSSTSIQTEMAPGLSSFNHLSDTVFVVEGKQFNLHKAIVTARCRWFAAMFEHNFKEKVGDNLFYIYILR
jgi:hypothetical protein